MCGLHLQSFFRQKKKKNLVSGNPTDPIFWGPTLDFFETSEIFSIFRVFLMIFMLFLYQNKFQKKKFGLPNNPKKFLEKRHFFFFFA